MPLAAIELIKKEPIRLVNTRIASCDGGGLTASACSSMTLCRRRRTWTPKGLHQSGQAGLKGVRVLVSSSSASSGADSRRSGLRFERSADHAHH